MNPIFAGTFFFLMLSGMVIYFTPWIASARRWDLVIRIALWVLAFGVVFAALLMTKSRSAFLAIVVTLPVIGLYLAGYHASVTRHFVVVRYREVIGLLVLLCLLGYGGKDLILERLSDDIQEIRLIKEPGIVVSNESRETDQGSPVTGRLLMWEFGLKGWYSKPIFGWGPGGMCRQGDLEKLDIWSLDPPSFYTGVVKCHHVHQSYIELLVRFGLVGLLLFVMMGLRLAYLAMRLTHKKGYFRVGLLGLTALTALAVANLTDSLVRSQQGWMLMAIAAGIILGAHYGKETADREFRKDDFQ